MIYNIIAMEINDFKLEELDFIEKVKTSVLYQEIKELSNKISKDNNLKKLSEERNKYYLLVNDAKTEEEKRKYQILAKEKNDLIINSPLVKDYLSKYHQMKLILDKINQEILKELNSD